MITIKPSAAIRENYSAISDLCKRSGEPFYLTKNGEDDLMVMDIASYARRESMLHWGEICLWPKKAVYKVILVILSLMYPI